MTTVLAFVTALAAIDIPGITREFAYPPTDLNTADLPAQWVQLPAISDEVSRTFTRHGELWGTFTAQLVVAYEAVGQSTQPANWSGTVALMDTVRTAMAGSGATFAPGKVSYTVRQGIVEVAGNQYWAVIAEVTAHG